MCRRLFTLPFLALTTIVSVLLVLAVRRGAPWPWLVLDTEAGRAKNRRVEIAIYASEASKAQVAKEHGS
jgi:hypothetical protein